MDHLILLMVVLVAVGFVCGCIVGHAFGYFKGRHEKSVVIQRFSGSASPKPGEWLVTEECPYSSSSPQVIVDDIRERLPHRARL